MASRKIPLGPQTRVLIEQQIDAFRKRFGRDPLPEDPLFFDPDQGTPQPYPEEKLKADWNDFLDEIERQGGILDQPTEMVGRKNAARK